MRCIRFSAFMLLIEIATARIIHILDLEAGWRVEEVRVVPTPYVCGYSTRDLTQSREEAKTLSNSWDDVIV